MCEFVSWIEKDDKIYFMSNDQLDTFEGEELREYLKDQFYEDITGHGAIKKYFGIKTAAFSDNEHEEECLRNPKRFPAVIVKAIKAGKMSKIGVPANPSDLLNAKAMREYKKGCDINYRNYEEASDALHGKIPLGVYERSDRYLGILRQEKDMEVFWEIFKKKVNRQKAWQ